MTKAIIISILFFNIGNLLGQDKTVNKIYQRTYEVYEKIQQGEHINALVLADEILDDYLDFQEGRKYIAYLYMYKAEAYLRLGDVMLSELCSRTAIEMAGLSGQNNFHFSIEGNLAALDIEKHDYYSCFHRCSRLLSNRHFEASKDQLGVTLNNMALSSFKIGNYHTADSLFTFLFELSEEEFPGDQFDRYLPYRNYGLYQLQAGRIEVAGKYLHKALNLYRKNLGESHFETLRTKLYCADYNMTTGVLSVVEDDIIEVISVLEHDTSSIRPSEYEYLLIRAYLMRAKYQYLTKSLSDRADNMALMESLNNLKKASDRIMFVMRYYSAGESGFSLAKVARPVYDFAVKVSLELFDLTNETKYFNQALSYSDMAKKLSVHSIGFLNHLTNSIPSLEEIGREFYEHRKKLSVSSESGSIEEEIQTYTRLKNRLDSVYGVKNINGLESGNRDDFLKMVRRNVLLSYHDLDSVYILMIMHKSGIKHSQIIKTDSLIRSIREIKELLSTERTGLYSRKEADRFTSLSTYVYKKLIKPVQFFNSGDLLLIQADGELSGLPFEALLDLEHKYHEFSVKYSFRDLPYLIRYNPVYYLSTIYQKPVKSARKGKTIHYDGHAFINQNEYTSSMLENGLDWASIRSKDYTGDNIYLNGCETGLGPYFSGEGTMSLGLSFLYSGANQVIENYWMAPEYSSNQISEEFYRYGGFKKPACALRKTKLRYLNNAPDGMDHPHYWAGTMIQGLTPDKKPGYYCLTIFLLFPLGFLLFGIKRRRA